MATFEWREEYSVKIEEMDKQHKKLFGLINGLAEATTNAATSQEVMGETLKGLIDYVKTHFDSEEKLLKKYDYSDYIEHRQAHINLTLNVVEFQQRYSNNSLSDAIELAGFLSKWLQGHIMGEDKRYGKYLNSKGIH
jgi:hemerythrin